MNDQDFSDVYGCHEEESRADNERKIEVNRHDNNPPFSLL